MLLSQTEWCARVQQQTKKIHAVFNERKKSEMKVEKKKQNEN